MPLSTQDILLGVLGLVPEQRLIAWEARIAEAQRRLAELTAEENGLSRILEMVSEQGLRGALEGRLGVVRQEQAELRSKIRGVEEQTARILAC